MNGIGFKVNLKTYQGLKAEAKQRKITLSEVCREVLTAYILSSNPSKRWVSIKDKFPDEGQQVLTYGIKPENIHDDSFPIITAIYERGYFNSDHFCESSSIINITHWMPLPSPPELPHD